MATQAVPGLAPAAVEALADLSREEVRLIFSHAGHLVHYGADTEGVEALVRLVSDVQRRGAADAAVRPGDEVTLAAEPPPRLPGTTFIVRYVGDDGTVDVQPVLTEDYVIETVPAAIVLRRADREAREPDR